MRLFDSLPAKRLLSICTPEALFSEEPVEAKQEYRALAAKWHPDHCKDASASKVFQHIVQLYREAQQKQADGSWDEPHEKVEEEQWGIKHFISTRRELKQVEYISIRPFELGRIYIANHSVTFEIKNEFEDLFNNARRQIRQFRFENADMAIEMTKSLPQIEELFQTKSSLFMKMRKTPDQLLLADILNYYAKRIDPIEHLGWIINVLLNISCYLAWSGITHNAITTETVFISPLRHSGMLLGGWWYSRPTGDDLEALPDRVIELLPDYLVEERIADQRIDLELIKALGRELLGDASGKLLLDDNTLPPALPEWLLMPSSDIAIDEYRFWKYEVLEECFGAPHFVNMDLDSKELYKEI